MPYAIWKTESGNVIGDFSAEAAALRAVLDAAALNGPTYIESFALVSDDDGKAKGIASGAELLLLARKRCGAISP